MVSLLVNIVVASVTYESTDVIPVVPIASSWESILFRLLIVLL